MLDISVDYMGIELDSPFMAASSGYTADIEKIVALARSGVGAIVLKSLFEEQINNEAGFLESQSAEYPENADFLQRYVTDYSVGRYAELIQVVKRKIGIPVIASINCFTCGSWTAFAKEVERAGADALELNIYSMPLSEWESSLEIEDSYRAIVREVSEGINIPVAVKIGENFTNLSAFVSSIKGYGACAAVLFNRFYRPDISLRSLKIVPANPFSCKSEYFKELRWIAILSSLVRNFDFSASTGVHDSNSAIKLMLAGAKTVQLCSVLYQQGPFVVSTFIEGLKRFMKEKGFASVSDFCGVLNYANIEHPQMFERVQFLKTAAKY